MGNNSGSLREFRTAVVNLGWAVARPFGIRPPGIAAAEEFIPRMSALGENPEYWLSAAARLAAVGVSPGAVDVFAKISAQGCALGADMVQLRRYGISVGTSE